MEHEPQKNIRPNNITTTLLNIDARVISLSTIKTEYKKLIRKLLIKLNRETEINKKESDRIN